MKYDIIAEAHEGVFSVPEEVFTQVEADSEEEALLDSAVEEAEKVLMQEGIIK